MNTVRQSYVHELAGGEIDVWVDTGGAICLKIRNQFNDPVELAENEALALAELLTQLVKEQREQSDSACAMSRSA